jgi:hypothetical protein
MNTAAIAVNAKISGVGEVKRVDDKLRARLRRSSIALEAEGAVRHINDAVEIRCRSVFDHKLGAGRGAAALSRCAQGHGAVPHNDKAGRRPSRWGSQIERQIIGDVHDRVGSWRVCPVRRSKHQGYVGTVHGYSPLAVGQSLTPVCASQRVNTRIQCNRGIPFRE